MVLAWGFEDPAPAAAHTSSSFFWVTDTAQCASTILCWMWKMAASTLLLLGIMLLLCNEATFFSKPSSEFLWACTQV